MGSSFLEIYCGSKAYDKIQNTGFNKENVKVVVAASGGAKWLTLSRLDQVLFPEILSGRTTPLYFLGSSIGTWRFMCAAQKDTGLAFKRFEEAYVNHVYKEPFTPRSIIEDSYALLNEVLGDDGVKDALENKIVRTNILTVKCKGLLTRENKTLLTIGLLMAAFFNVFSRKSLGFFMERALFSDQRDYPPFYDMPGFPIEHFSLTSDNFKDSIMASSSIPLVMEGIKDIKGAKCGVYRDGGFLDYHFDIPFLCGEDGLVLYPHFFNKITPGWFDKHLKWRKPNPKNYENVILICPSNAFVEKLLGGKIPDRADFKNYSPKERIENWKKTLCETDRLADEFLEIIEKNEWAKKVKPLF